MIIGDRGYTLIDPKLHDLRPCIDDEAVLTFGVGSRRVDVQAGQTMDRAMGGAANAIVGTAEGALWYQALDPASAEYTRYLGLAWVTFEGRLVVRLVRGRALSLFLYNHGEDGGDVLPYAVRPGVHHPFVHVAVYRDDDGWHMPGVPLTCTVHHLTRMPLGVGHIAAPLEKKPHDTEQWLVLRDYCVDHAPLAVGMADAGLSYLDRFRKHLLEARRCSGPTAEQAAHKTADKES